MSFKNILTDNNKIAIGILGIILAIVLFLFDSRFMLILVVIAPILLIIFKTNKTIGIISFLVSIGCLIAGLYNIYILFFVYIPRGYMYGQGGSFGLMPIKVIFSLFLMFYSLFCSYCLTVDDGHNDKFCSKCGKAVSDKDTYCPSCGCEL